MSEPSYEELIASYIADALSGCRNVSVGTAAPLHAMGALLASARTGGRMAVGMLGSARDNFYHNGGHEMFDAAASGRIDGFMLGGGQVDGVGNINLWGRGEYPNYTVRWPGNFGSPLMYSVTRKVVLVIEEHTTRKLPDRVDFISAAGSSPQGAPRTGGPSALVTSRCVFRFNRETRRFELQSVHPDSSVEDVIANTGFKVILPDVVPVTPQPTKDDLSFLRGPVIDRLRSPYPLFAARLEAQASA